MKYRRNADRSIRDLEREYSSGDATLLPALVSARIRSGRSLVDLEPADRVMPILLDYLASDVRRLVNNLSISELVIFELDLNDTPWGEYAAAHGLQEQLIDVVREVVSFQIRILFKELRENDIKTSYDAEKIIEEHQPGFILRPIVDVSNVSMDDIARKGLIPQFNALQGPNMHWFGHHFAPSIEHEKWHEWYVVGMHPTVFDVAREIGIKILLIHRNGFPIDPLNVNTEGMLEEEMETQFGDYGPDSRVPMFLVKTKDIFQLARYFALASRRIERNKHYDYGSLPPGRGWGEYIRKLGSRDDLTVWLAQKELLDSGYLKILNEDNFIEIKAPDTGSLLTGERQFNRDEEWM